MRKYIAAIIPSANDEILSALENEIRESVSIEYEIYEQQPRKRKPDRDVLEWALVGPRGAVSYKPRNLLINWKRVLSAHLIVGASYAASPITGPIPAVVAVLNYAREMWGLSKLEINISQALVIRSLFEIGGRGTAAEILQKLISEKSADSYCDTVDQVEHRLTELSQIGVVRIIDGVPQLQERVTIMR